MLESGGETGTQGAMLKLALTEPFTTDTVSSGAKSSELN
jgi:hypothetical protein